MVIPVWPALHHYLSTRLWSTTRAHQFPTPVLLGPSFILHLQAPSYLTEQNMPIPPGGSCLSGMSMLHHQGSQINRSQHTLPQDHPTGHEYAPPIGPPPSQYLEEPIPYHDWTVIPDTALLPPPPSFSYETSPSNNANLAEADRAHEWCRRYHLTMPHLPTPAQHSDVINGDVLLMKPREFNGELSMVKRGFWKGSARTGDRDSCLITAAPLYFAFADSPVHTGVSKTIYFEVKLRSLGSQHRSTGGFCCFGILRHAISNVETSWMGKGKPCRAWRRRSSIRERHIWWHGFYFTISSWGYDRT